MVTVVDGCWLQMALSGCSSGLVVTAVVALLLLPAQYYVPDLYTGVEAPLAASDQLDSPAAAFGWLDLAFVHLPPLDLFVTVSLLVLGMLTYLCEWIQRKLMERRIVKVGAIVKVCQIGTSNRTQES